MKAQVYDGKAAARLQEAQAALQAAAQRLGSLRSEGAELKRARRDAAKQCDALQTSREKLALERQALPQQLKELEARHAALQESARPMTQAEKGEEARLGKEAEAAGEACKGAQKAAGVVEAAIADLKERIVNAGGEDMRRAKQAAAQAQKALDDTAAEVGSSR
jgi:chromosome segregation ATPase